MPNDLIRYDLLVQEALCGVVSRVLADVSRHGLPGDHHFYITFRTHAPGVRLSSRMREQYPDEMTIILQHQFEDLKVTDHGFEVGLSFKGIPEILLIPFDALTGFFDPSVQFSLKFEPQSEEDAEPSKPDAKLEPSKPATVATLPQPVKPGLPVPVKTGLPAPVKVVPANERPGDGKSAEVAEEAKVVSIDAFRKKPWAEVGDVVNLRRARKLKQRTVADAAAAAARLRHGRSRSEREVVAMNADRAARLLDGAKLDEPEASGPAAPNDGRG